MKIVTNRTTASKAKAHDTTTPLLIALYQEFKDLAKKTPDAAVSKGKIALVNRLLGQVRIALDGEDSLQFLDLLDEDNVPQVSDVTIMLSQYVTAMQSFKQSYHGWNGADHVWFIA